MKRIGIPIFIEKVHESSFRKIPNEINVRSDGKLCIGKTPICDYKTFNHSVLHYLKYGESQHRAIKLALCGPLFGKGGVIEYEP